MDVLFLGLSLLCILGGCDVYVMPCKKFSVDLIGVVTWVPGKMCFWVLGTDVQEWVQATDLNLCIEGRKKECSTRTC